MYTPYQTLVIAQIRVEISGLLGDIEKAKQFNEIESQKYFKGRLDSYQHCLAMICLIGVNQDTREIE